MTSLHVSLRRQQHPLICQLANAIERIWENQLILAPYDIPADLGYIENHLEGERLVIENHCYQTPQFRKIHLELAKVGNGLDILHCVMFPRADYPLPVFGCDIVGARGSISAAIVDLSPVRSDRHLPARYHSALSALPEIVFEQPRDLPEWGDIFSQFCTFVRPISQSENLSFIERVEAILRLHCEIASQTFPVQSISERKSIIEGQFYYCDKQLKNDKTRRILEKSFGKKWAKRYMETMLFDMITV